MAGGIPPTKGTSLTGVRGLLKGAFAINFARFETAGRMPV